MLRTISQRVAAITAGYREREFSIFSDTPLPDKIRGALI
jgi:hypothetical protein